MVVAIIRTGTDNAKCSRSLYIVTKKAHFAVKIVKFFFFFLKNSTWHTFVFHFVSTVITGLFNCSFDIHSLSYVQYLYSICTVFVRF